MKRHKTSVWFVALLIGIAFYINACDSQGQVTVSESTSVPQTVASQAATVLPTSTNVPTPTTIPAAEINGEMITMAEYQAEIARFHAAVNEDGTEMATIQEEDVLNDLIDQVLLAQAARENGFQADETIVQQRIDQLNIGEEAFQKWLDEHGYTEEEFRRIFARAIEAAWMRDKIAASVPEYADQIHARQILLFSEEEAQEVYQQLQSGADFESLANAYDPVTGGDLGWFPKGYLLQPEIDPIVFSLEVGQYSEVIKTEVGYHIIQVIDRDEQHPLNYDALNVLKHKAVSDWLLEKREQSEIIVNVP